MTLDRKQKKNKTTNMTKERKAESKKKKQCAKYCTCFKSKRVPCVVVPNTYRKAGSIYIQCL